MPSKRPSPLNSGIENALAAVASALESLPAPGMIIGGIAVILQGVPRVTRDVDATVEAASIPLESLASHLQGYDIVPRIHDALSFASANQVLLLRHQSSGIDVDMSLAWLPFEVEAIAARERLVHGRINAQVATPEDLVIYKAVAWRPQDQQDVERLLTLHGRRIDLARVRSVVAEFAEALDEPDRLAQVERVIRRTTENR